MNTQLPSRERLEEIAIAYGNGHHTKVNVKDDEVLQIVESLLAAHEQEQVAGSRSLYTCSACGCEGLDEPPETQCHCYIDGAHWLESKVFSHPAPVPAVPDEVLSRLEHEANHITAWHHMDEHSCKVSRRDLLTLVNACRAAMLNGGKS